MKYIHTALILMALLVIIVESAYTREPGVGFGFALVFVILAAVLGWVNSENDQ